MNWMKSTLYVLPEGKVIAFSPFLFAYEFVLNLFKPQFCLLFDYKILVRIPIVYDAGTKSWIKDQATGKCFR